MPAKQRGHSAESSSASPTAVGLRGASRPSRCALARPVASGPGGGDGGRDHHRSLGIDLEDAEAEDAVGDLEVVVELLEQLGRRLEAEPAVVGLVALR